MLKLILGILFIASTSKTEPLKDALDGMQAFMNSQNPSFDSEFYQELVTCLNFLDPRLLTSVGAQWDGMIEYAGTQGAPNDTWASCPDTKWFEYNCTVQAYGSMPIYEPCNYASNIAYYHTATEICAREHWHLPEIHVKAMGMNFAILAQGSAFFHGSETSNGGAADVIINDLFAYVAFQAAFEGTVTSNDNPIIHDLSLEPRSKSGAEVTSDFIDMYINVPVEEWGDLLESADVPNLRLTMCGYFSTVLTLLYPPEMVDEIVDYLLGQFTDMTEDIKVFCLQEFLPEIRNVVTKNQTLPHNEWLAFEGNTFSTLIKLLYAFLWQVCLPFFARNNCCGITQPFLFL